MAEIAEIGSLITAIGVLLVAIGGFYLLLRISELVDAFRDKIKGMKIE